MTSHLRLEEGIEESSGLKSGLMPSQGGGNSSTELRGGMVGPEWAPRGGLESFQGHMCAQEGELHGQEQLDWLVDGRSIAGDSPEFR